MGAILLRFVEIALLRKGPQDLPALGFLVALALGLHIGVSILWVQISPETMYEAAIGEVLNVVLLYLLVGGLLRFVGQPSRFNATLSALLGSEAVISAAAIPAVLLIGMPQDPEQIGTPHMLLIVATAVWNITVMAHILRLATGLSRLVAVAIAVVFALTYIRLFLGVVTVPS